LTGLPFEMLWLMVIVITTQAGGVQVVQTAQPSEMVCRREIKRIEREEPQPLAYNREMFCIQNNIR
jgi:hypothetical protein